MASTEVRTENNRTQIPAGDDVDRTTQDLNHLDLNNHNGSVLFGGEFLPSYSDCSHVTILARFLKFKISARYSVNNG